MATQNFPFAVAFNCANARNKRASIQYAKQATVHAGLPSQWVTMADPGKNLTGALHSNFGRGGCGGRG